MENREVLHIFHRLLKMSFILMLTFFDYYSLSFLYFILNLFPYFEPLFFFSFFFYIFFSIYNSFISSSFLFSLLHSSFFPIFVDLILRKILIVIIEKHNLLLKELSF